jgi:hypothetical protein
MTIFEKNKMMHHTIDKKEILKDIFHTQLDHLFTEKTVAEICFMIEQVADEAWRKGFAEGNDLWKDVMKDIGKEKKVNNINKI